MENRIYLWLFLTNDIIEKSSSAYNKTFNFDTLMSSLPLKIFDADEKVLIKSTDTSIVVILFQFIVVATRSFSLIKVLYERRISE